MSKTPKFFYFDMGNVLLILHRQRAVQKMAELAGVTVEVVGQLVTDSTLELQYEAGEVSSREFYEIFCKETKSEPDYDQLALAASSMFEINLSMMVVLGKMISASIPVGLLSNTNDIHWEYVANGRYSFFPGSFRKTILSYEVGSNKPDAKIYQAAIEQCGCAAEDIMFVDDKPENVQAAKEQGIDAVVYTTTDLFIKELQMRDVQLNY